MIDGGIINKDSAWILAKFLFLLIKYQHSARINVQRERIRKLSPEHV